MESTQTRAPLKLNYKRTMLIGFAFFGILLLWRVYDSWCPTLLTQLFKNAFGLEDEKQVQYLVGVMMAIDNLAALILLPIFGRLSDKTRTPIGKRMPYILAGTVVCAIAFPFIPVFYHNSQVGGVIAMMLIVVVFAMMYRNPAVALMPDITPKPLRSKANGIINIMGYIGGAFATVVGIFFVLSDYLGTAVNKDGTPKAHTWAFNNIWAIEAPFLIASVLMVISAVVLFLTVRENELAEKMKEEMAQGEEEAEVVDKVTEDAPLSKANRNMLLLILGAEFFWFMADNGIATFMGNYAIYFLKTSSASNMINTIVGGIGSVVGFALGGIIASKIGRKWTLFGGLGLSLLSYPRFVEVYGDIMEKGIGLCCEESVRLLLTAEGTATSPIAFIEREINDEPDEIPDDAREARDAIFSEREHLFKILADRARPLNERLVEMMDYAVETSGIEFCKPNDEPSSDISNNVLQSWIDILGKGESFGPAWDHAYKELSQHTHNSDPNKTGSIGQSVGLITPSDGEKIIAYLLFRYYAKSLFDGNSLIKVQFALYFWIMLQKFGKIFAKTADAPLAATPANVLTEKIAAIKLLSKQTEYSEEIMGILEEEFMNNPLFSPENFKKVIMA